MVIGPSTMRSLEEVTSLASGIKKLAHEHTARGLALNLGISRRRSRLFLEGNAIDAN